MIACDTRYGYTAARGYDANVLKPPVPGIGSSEPYSGWEDKVPRSFRHTAGRNEEEGELACVVNTQECSPQDKAPVLLPYAERWNPANLTDIINCSDWITRQEIMASCCKTPADSTSLPVKCTDGIPNTCTVRSRPPPPPSPLPTHSPRLGLQHANFLVLLLCLGLRFHFSLCQKLLIY